MQKEIKAGKWNINAEWAASLSESEFVQYAEENFGMSAAEAKKVYAQAKPKKQPKPEEN